MGNSDDTHPRGEAGHRSPWQHRKFLSLKESFVFGVRTDILLSDFFSAVFHSRAFGSLALSFPNF